MPQTPEVIAELAYENRLAEASSNLSRVAAGAIGVGILAFLFGHFLAIPRWASAMTVGLGLLVATMAPQLIEFFGSDHAHYLMLGTFAVLAIGALLTAGLWVWDKVKHLTPLADKPSGDKAFHPYGPHERPDRDDKGD